MGLLESGEMTIEEALKNERLGSMPLSRPTCVHPSTSLDETLQVMRPEGIGAVLVCDGRKLVGIFTERDVLLKLFANGVDRSQPVEKFMTPNPRILTPDDTLGEAVRLMTERGYRHIPIGCDKGGEPGLITAREIINYIAEHFPAEVVNLPPHPDQTYLAPEGA